MANVLKKFINNWTVYNLPNPKVFVITESDVTVTTTDEYWVAPYNTSYYYTNIQVNNTQIEWIEWALYIFIIDTTLVVPWTYRNIRIRLWSTWDWKPLMWPSSSILAWSSYFTKWRMDLYVYKSTQQSWWALHMNNDTSYSDMTEAVAKAWTNTTTRTIKATVLKTAILYHAATLHDSTKQDTLTAWNNIDITSNTISSDSTQAITQSDYDNLPSTKTSNHKTYMIYYEETI